MTMGKVQTKKSKIHIFYLFLIWNVWLFINHFCSFALKVRAYIVHKCGAFQSDYSNLLSKNKLLGSDWNDLSSRKKGDFYYYGNLSCEDMYYCLDAIELRYLQICSSLQNSFKVGSKYYSFNFSTFRILFSHSKNKHVWQIIFVATQTLNMVHCDRTEMWLIYSF